ncbi:uncharacterized protein V3H82_021565 [Fundulus diaphanus]
MNPTPTQSLHAGAAGRDLAPLSANSAAEQLIAQSRDCLEILASLSPPSRQLGAVAQVRKLWKSQAELLPLFETTGLMEELEWIRDGCFRSALRQNASSPILHSCRFHRCCCRVCLSSHHGSSPSSSRSCRCYGSCRCCSSCRCCPHNLITSSSHSLAARLLSTETPDSSMPEHTHC